MSNALRRVTALACVACLTLALSGVPASASAASSASIARSLGAKRKQAATIEVQLATTRQELTNALEKSDEIDAQLEQARADLAVTSDTLSQLDTQISTGQDTLNERAVALYKSGGLDVLQALLSVESLDDLMSRVDMLSYIQQSDDDLLHGLTTARDQSAFLQGQQTQREDDLIALRQEADARTATVQTLIAQQKTLMDSIGKSVQGLIKKEEAAKAREAAAAAAGTAGVPNPPVGFSPNTLISQAKYTDSGSLTAAGIQGFLNAQPGDLKSYSGRDYNGTVKSAADMIADAAAAWHVSPKVILVTLQKEQSLLTDSSPSQHTMDWAMGCGATDSGRLAGYSGFGRQIWMGARALSRNQGNWHSGISISIDGNAVYPSNAATFSLYRYTPHFHGNQMFWKLYWRYFASPVS